MTNWMEEDSKKYQELLAQKAQELKQQNPSLGAPLLKEQQYRIPTLTERIETLEQQVNHLMHLIGTKG